MSQMQISEWINDTYQLNAGVGRQQFFVDYKDHLDVPVVNAPMRASKANKKGGMSITNDEGIHKY